MNKIAKIAMLASALIIPNLANAAPADGTYRGPVVVKKGLTLNCTLQAVISGSGTSTTLALSPGNLLCASVGFNSQPYVTTSTATTYTISGLDVTTITPGDCQGSASGSYTATTLSVSATLPPSVPGTEVCTIAGNLTKQ